MINVTKTYLPNREKYKSYIDRIFDSGWLTNNGQLVQELERRLEDFLGVQNLILVANGTLALQVAFKALMLKKGNIITTPFTFVATTSSMVWEGFTPKYADIEPDSFNISPRKIEPLINTKTSAILPVHVFGNACDIMSIQEIARKSDTKVIYDAAHCFGVKYLDNSILAYGDASVLSFHSTKIFHTIEGGAIVFKDREAFLRAKLIINFGIPNYDSISSLGINCKMNEFQAAMGLCILDDFEKISNSRRKIWQRYIEAFSSFEKIKLQHINPDSKINYSYFPIVFNDESTMLKVKNELNLKDIWPRRYFYPSLENLPYLDCNDQVPISSSISTRILCLPIYDSLDEVSQNTIISTILELK